MVARIKITAYYNEIDPFAAQWLRNLIEAGLIAPGHVDERSIEDVKPSELTGYTQCHFFAGIGGWSYALRLAGWPDDKPVWTASLPCQPFSVASVAHGGAKGQEDERHLLPQFIGLVRECNPSVIYGEQVANAIKWGWLDECFDALESLGYSCDAEIKTASHSGADHQRKRLYWNANTSRSGWPRHQPLECFLIPTEKAFPINRDPLVRARRALAGDYLDLLPHDGVSIAVERSRTKGYGNAIVPQVAEAFIRETTCQVKGAQYGS